MGERATRRSFLRAASVITAGTVLPLGLPGIASAEDGRAMLAPTDPDADIPAVTDYWYGEGVSREPLNGWVHCTNGGER